MTDTPTLDGPLINGRPALSVEAVQKWFTGTCKVVPTEDAASPIAASLNHCALFEAHWKDTSEFKQIRRTNPSNLRMEHIGAALRTLGKELPVLIDDTRKALPNAKNDELIALLDLVNKFEPGFRKFKRTRGAESKAWHRIARNLGPLIVAALKSAGVKRAGFGQITSPAVEIMQSALKYLGVTASLVAIVDAMRGRKKNGKIRR